MGIQDYKEIDAEAAKFREKYVCERKDEITALPLTREQQMAVVEWLANKYWQILLDLNIQDGHCKSYDPLLIEGGTAHSYVFDLEDGGRHHDFRDLNHLVKMLDSDMRSMLRGELTEAAGVELKAKNL